MVLHTTDFDKTCIMVTIRNPYPDLFQEDFVVPNYNDYVWDASQYKNPIHMESAIVFTKPACISAMMNKTLTVGVSEVLQKGKLTKQMGSETEQNVHDK
jgi:hypothetical protein